MKTGLKKREKRRLKMKKEVNMRSAPDKKKSIKPPYVAKMDPDGRIVTDPYGSYTGVSADGEKPIQDVDDL